MTMSIPTGSGSIDPPNKASGLMWIQYKPRVELSLSDGLVPGDSTSLPVVTAFATFSTAVTGVTLGAFNVIGGTPSGLVALTPSV